MSTTIAVKKEVTSRTIRLHLSAREIFDRLLIGEHTVTLKQIVHHIPCRGRRWRWLAGHLRGDYAADLRLVCGDSATSHGPSS